ENFFEHDAIFRSFPSSSPLKIVRLNILLKIRTGTYIFPSFGFSYFYPYFIQKLNILVPMEYNILPHHLLTYVYHISYWNVAPKFVTICFLRDTTPSNNARFAAS